VSPPSKPSRPPREATPPSPVAVIPAAGRARRLGHLPCSKELLPIAVDPPPPKGEGTGGESDSEWGSEPDSERGPRVRVVSERLLAALRLGGVTRGVMVIDSSKTDLPRFYARRRPTPELAFVPIRSSPSVPHTIRAALPLVGEAPVAFGFPDVLFAPEDAFARVDHRRREHRAALSLGLFPAENPATTDMVDFAPDGQVRAIEVRPAHTRLTLCWLIAVWDRRFSGWLTERLGQAGMPESHEPELQLGALFEEARAAGLPVVAVPFPGGGYLDVGTPEGYARALAHGPAAALGTR